MVLWNFILFWTMIRTRKHLLITGWYNALPPIDGTKFHTCRKAATCDAKTSRDPCDRTYCVTYVTLFNTSDVTSKILTLLGSQILPENFIILNKYIPNLIYKMIFNFNSFISLSSKILWVCTSKIGGILNVGWRTFARI